MTWVCKELAEKLFRGGAPAVIVLEDDCHAGQDKRRLSGVWKRAWDGLTAKYSDWAFLLLGGLPLRSNQYDNGSCGTFVKFHVRSWGLRTSIFTYYVSESALVHVTLDFKLMVSMISFTLASN